jgi:hypothetical protein
MRNWECERWIVRAFRLRKVEYRNQPCALSPACRAIVKPYRDDGWRLFLFSAFRIPTSAFLTPFTVWIAED